MFELKKIGNIIYIHRTAIDILEKKEKQLVEECVKLIPKKFCYEIIKINLKKQEVSFIFSPNWDIAPEPFVGDSYKVNFKEKNILYSKSKRNNKQIYHHKWMFVKEDYKGFDIEKSKKRSILWENSDLQFDKKKIGNWNYWNEEVLSKLEKNNEIWKYGITFKEMKEKQPSTYEGSEQSNSPNYKPHPTQVNNTIYTYEKIFKYLKSQNFKGTILDASSGKGLGTLKGRELGFEIEDVEPFPPLNYQPMYYNYEKINKKYDVIICNMVLNVIPQDTRDELVYTIFNKLNQNGTIYFIVRHKRDIEKQKSGIPFNPNKEGKDMNCEYFFPSKKSYQKGFTNKELKAYLEDLLNNKNIEIKTINYQNSGLKNSVGVVLKTKTNKI